MKIQSKSHCGIYHVVDLRHCYFLLNNNVKLHLKNIAFYNFYNKAGKIKYIKLELNTFNRSFLSGQKIYYKPLSNLLWDMDVPYKLSPKEGEKIIDWIHKTTSLINHKIFINRVKYEFARVGEEQVQNTFNKIFCDNILNE